MSAEFPTSARNGPNVMLIHFGPLQVVDEVNQMCYLRSDPTEAARAITKRFMRTDLEPRDKPIFEEFERTKLRWNEQE